MNSDKKFAFLVLGIPLVGLVYCGLGITAMASSMTIRTHPIVSGAIFILIPLGIAAFTWIRASAKAYKK
ncbi:hypothetical protein I4641_11940 [Waterburya agarophytonicola K14]|uniref:Uncharacterized protein n=2 Tax=Waterburya TaxID=2886915 RepID=A0A964BQQ5_9CYAN|nr:hypothetical protein [Waterburya agarophytonicola KI4]